MNISKVQQLTSVLTTLVKNSNEDRTNQNYIYSGAIAAVLKRIQAEVEKEGLDREDPIPF